MPEGVVGTVSTYSCSLAVWYLAKRWPHLQCRAGVIIIGELIGMIACLLLYVLPLDDVGGRLACLWLAKFFLGPYIISLQLNVANISGHTKKVTVQALIFIAYCGMYHNSQRLSAAVLTLSGSLEHHRSAIFHLFPSTAVPPRYGRHACWIRWCYPHHIRVCGILLV